MPRTLIEAGPGAWDWKWECDEDGCTGVTITKGGQAGQPCPADWRFVPFSKYGGDPDLTLVRCPDHAAEVDTHFAAVDQWRADFTKLDDETLDGDAFDALIAGNPPPAPPWIRRDA